jgi:hypothetical protein
MLVVNLFVLSVTSCCSILRDMQVKMSPSVKEDAQMRKSNIVVWGLVAVCIIIWTYLMWLVLTGIADCCEY